MTRMRAQGGNQKRCRPEHRITISAYVNGYAITLGFACPDRKGFLLCSCTPVTHFSADETFHTNQEKQVKPRLNAAIDLEQHG